MSSSGLGSLITFFDNAADLHNRPRPRFLGIQLIHRRLCMVDRPSYYLFTTRMILIMRPTSISPSLPDYYGIIPRKHLSKVSSFLDRTASSWYSVDTPHYHEKEIQQPLHDAKSWFLSESGIVDMFVITGLEPYEVDNEILAIRIALAYAGPVQIPYNHRLSIYRTHVCLRQASESVEL